MLFIFEGLISYQHPKNLCRTRTNFCGIRAFRLHHFRNNQATQHSVNAKKPSVPIQLTTENFQKIIFSLQLSLNNSENSRSTCFLRAIFFISIALWAVKPAGNGADSRTSKSQNCILGKKCNLIFLAGKLYRQQKNSMNQSCGAEGALSDGLTSFLFPTHGRDIGWIKVYPPYFVLTEKSTYLEN